MGKSKTTDSKEVNTSEESKTEEVTEKPKSNTILVSDLQPQRSKPAYPHDLGTNRGFGYNP